MEAEELTLWKQVYVAFIASGSCTSNLSEEAANAADEAVEHLRDRIQGYNASVAKMAKRRLENSLEEIVGAQTKT